MHAKLHRQVLCYLLNLKGRQVMFVWRISEASSRSHCCSGKAIIITYYECVSIALSIQQAMCILRIVICGLSGSVIFFGILVSHKQHDFLKKKVIERKMCLDFLHGFCVKHFSFQEQLSDIWFKMCRAYPQIQYPRFQLSAARKILEN